MKQILKSLLVLAIVAGTTVGATGAYFSSSVTAADNEINTGVLAMAVDSTRAHNYVGTWNTGTGLGWDATTAVGGVFDAYVVAYDLDGVSTAGSGPLEAWDLAAPGVYSAYTGAAGFETLSEGNRSVWFTVRNWGSVSAKAYVAFNGDWTNMRTAGACSTEVPNDALIQSENVHVYRNGASGCENHEECRNLRDSLITQGYTLTNDTDLNTALDYTAEQTLDGSSFALSSNGTTVASTPITLDGGEFAIVRLDMNFDENESDLETNINCYQGATYLYDVNVTGTQVADPAWF